MYESCVSKACSHNLLGTSLMPNFGKWNCRISFKERQREAMNQLFCHHLHIKIWKMCLQLTCHYTHCLSLCHYLTTMIEKRKFSFKVQPTITNYNGRRKAMISHLLYLHTISSLFWNVLHKNGLKWL